MNFQDIKNQNKIHFIGIGGIGMSALALILREFDVMVQGSDLSENYLTEKLRNAGINYSIGQRAENINDDVSLIVKTSIIKDANPEIIEAKRRGLKIITRAELLAIIMSNYQGITIAGTHGKTSTTGITSVIFEVAKLDPTVLNGGVIHHFGSNSKIGQGKYLIAESDESDASFVILPTKIGAIINIEPEHLDFAGYGGDFSKQQACFEQYVEQIPRDGACALCVDDFETKKLYEKFKDSKNNLITDSILENPADLMAKNIKVSNLGLNFDIEFLDGKKITDIKMPIYGKHNIANALCASAIANFAKIPLEKIKEGLEKFNGVKRRFTKVGEFEGVSIIDDYAHHPTEIEATLEAAKMAAGDGNVICVIEPHKYSRLKDNFDHFCKCFALANYVIVTPIYAAGQEPIEGISQDSLIAGIQKTGKENIIKLEDPKNLAKIVKPIINSGDIIFCAGAGKITYFASDLENDLKNL